MNPQRTVQSTWFTMLILQSVGTIDAKHKLPAPKQYVAINVLWGILFLLCDTGFARIAKQLSFLVLLTATVAGPFGGKLITWLRTISKYFAIPPSPDAAAEGGLTSSGPTLT